MGDEMTELWRQLLTETVVGFEEDEDEDDDDSSDDDDSDDDDDDSEDDSEEDDDEDDDDKPKTKKKSKVKDLEEANAGLKTALRKERQLRRTEKRRADALEKRVTALEKTKTRTKKKEDDQDDSAVNEAKEASDKARNEKFAARLQTNAVDTAITLAATNPKTGLQFRDIEDALRLVDRKDIDVDQDPDEPDQIDIDQESVVDALRALAKSKPHLLNKKKKDDEEDEDEEDDERRPSGGKVGQRRRKRSGELTEQQLREKYGALNQ